MQVKELKKDGLKHELEVIVSAKDIDVKIDERLREVGETVNLPGFRKGKAPLNLLKQRYGRSVMADVLERAVNDSTAQAIKDKGLRPALQPKIEVKEFDEGKDLKYTVAIEVLPEFKVTDVKKISLEKPVVKADAKAVDEALQRIAAGNRDSEVVTEKRAAKKGDIVVIDFKGRTADDNVEHPGMAGTGHNLELGGGRFIPGFEDQLVGKKAGDSVDVKVTFPKPYHSDELAGRDAIFAVTITELRAPKDAVIDDEFAKKLGMESEKALRDAVQAQIQKEYDQFSRAKVKRALLDELDDAHDFEIPAGMLEMEFGSILHQIKMERQQRDPKDEGKISDEEQEELKAIAERRVRLGMILSEIGRENNIGITDQEVQRAVIAEAQKYPGQEAQVFEFFRSNRQALDSLRAPVFEDKVVDFVLELADVKDKTVTLEELTKEEDEESYLEKKKGGKKAAKKAKK